MRNLSEQKRIVIPVVWLVALAIVYALIFIVFFLNSFKIDASLFGYRFYDFNEVVEEVDPYDVDEGESMVYIKAGSKILVKECTAEELEKNDVFAYYVKDGTEDVIVTQIFLQTYGEEGKETIYTSHNLDSRRINSYTIDSGKMLGKHVLVVPALGMVTAYLTYYPWLTYVSLVVLALFLLGLPIVSICLRVKQRHMGSPFPEGVNVNRLSTENLYIYENMRVFLRSAGMVIDKGYDCDLLYVGDILFGVLHCTNGNMYVNVNKNFQRYDTKIDRAGYICIPHAANLEGAKKRVNSIYRAYFLDMKHAQIG